MTAETSQPNSLDIAKVTLGGICSLILTVGLARFSLLNITDNVKILWVNNYTRAGYGERSVRLCWIWSVPC